MTKSAFPLKFLQNLSQMLGYINCPYFSQNRGVTAFVTHRFSLSWALLVCQLEKMPFSVSCSYLD